MTKQTKRAEKKRIIKDLRKKYPELKNVKIDITLSKKPPFDL